MASLNLPHLGITLSDGMEARIRKYDKTRYFKRIKITKCDKGRDSFCARTPCFGYRINDATEAGLFFCSESFIQHVEIISAPEGCINKVMEL